MSTKPHKIYAKLFEIYAPLKNLSFISLYFLSFFLVLASIARFPFLDQINEFKFSIMGAEILSTLILLLHFRRRWLIILWMGGIAFSVIFRLLWSSAVANIFFEQSFSLSFQESRFGFMIISTPLIYYFFKYASGSVLKKLIFSYLFLTVTLDLFIYIFFSGTGLLVIGQRTDDRFVSSILIPLISLSLFVLKQPKTNREPFFTITACVLMLIHTTLITTSRIESFFVLGVLGFITVRNWPKIRKTLMFLVISTSVFAATAFEINLQKIGGRSYLYALKVAENGIPFGFGSVTDITAKRLLHFPDDFFFSDYGVILYVIRYGVLGIFIIFMLLFLLLYFVIHSFKLRGFTFIAIPIITYLVTIPFLDYGSFNGGFLLAFMLIVPTFIQSELKKKKNV